MLAGNPRPGKPSPALPSGSLRHRFNSAIRLPNRGGTLSRIRVPPVLLILALAACGGDDGSAAVSPQTNTCIGTCLVVSNQSDSLTINEVYYSACADAEWGQDRLSGSQVLRPGSSRGWQVAPGCWDFMAARQEPGERWQSISYGIDLAAGGSYTLVFDL